MKGRERTAGRPAAIGFLAEVWGLRVPIWVREVRGTVPETSWPQKGLGERLDTPARCWTPGWGCVPVYPSMISLLLPSNKWPASVQPQRDICGHTGACWLKRKEWGTGVRVRVCWAINVFGILLELCVGSHFPTPPVES